MILFRDPLSHGGTRMPSFLEGCPEVQRLVTETGDVLSTGDPVYLSVPTNAIWSNIGDGWQMCLNGDPELDRHIRDRNDLQTVELQDCFGRTWHAPKVLDADGECFLPLSWGRENGLMVRKPTNEQSKLITAATAGRKEIVNNTLGQVPIEIAYEWVCTLLESTYYLNGETLLACGLITDELAAHVLLAAGGFPRV